MLIDKLHPMTRQVLMQDIKDQWEQRQWQENDPPGTRPPPEPPHSPERAWSPCPREEQIELLNELNEVLIVGYPYTGRDKILDKLTPEEYPGRGLEKAHTFMREQQQKYNYPRRKGG